MAKSKIKDIADMNAESNVLGGILAGDGDITKLSTNDFTDVTYTEIMRSIISLNNRGSKITKNSIDMYMLEHFPVKDYWEHHGQTVLGNLEYVYDGDYDYSFEKLKKYTLLRSYAKNGIDVSEFCDPTEIDSKEIIKQREKFESLSLEELKSHFESLIYTINNTVQGIKFNPFSCTNPSKLPGIDNKMTWLVDGLFYTSTFQIISAKAKGGKSQFAYQLATCLNNGTDFLGHKVKQSRCLYIDCELSNCEIYGRTEACEKFLNIDQANRIELNLIPLKRTIFNLDEIISGVKKGLKSNPDIDVIFFDNFYSFFDGNINDSSEVRSVLNKLSSISETATMFLICHNNKTTGQNGGTDNAIYAASGSNAFAGYADEFVSIEEKDAGRAKVIHIDGRHIRHQSIPCWYNESTNYFFEPIKDEQEAKILINEPSSLRKMGRSREYLKENHPELYEYIANESNIRTTKRIMKLFPGETAESLRDKGFWYSSTNKNNNGPGIKTDNWYVRDTRK